MIKIQPIFKEYIQFLKDQNIDIGLQEGYYWLNNQVIKVYDTEGNLHKVARLKIDNKLNIICNPFKKEYFKMEHWNDTIIRNKTKLDEREKKSLELIKNKLQKYNDHIPIIFTSTGKDSEETRYLVNKAINKYLIHKKPAIMFNNTSMDCADTYKMVKTIPECIIVNPKEGFYNKIKTVGVPTRHHRWCCSVYKEGATRNYLDDNEKYIFFYGMRNDESPNRAEYQDEKFDDRWQDRDWIGILPIVKWTEEEVWLHMLSNNIPMNSKYRKGYARVGCAIACPYYTKTTWILDKYWYPTMYNRFQQFLIKDFYERQLWCALNCTIEEYPLCWNGGAIRSEPTEEVVKECAEYKGIDIEVAKKYFNKKCKCCGNKITKNDVIAMNMKLLGRNIEEYMCKKCLRKFLNISVEQWKNYISEFKQSGCNLF